MPLLATLEWVGQHENLCLAGPSGTGKSQFLEALGHHAIDPPGSPPPPASPSTSATPLLRQHLHKGTGLSVKSAADLLQIQHSLNDRLRKTLSYTTPLEEYALFVAPHPLNPPFYR